MTTGHPSSTASRKGETTGKRLFAESATIFLEQNLARLGGAPDREYNGGTATRRGRVDRLDVDARLRQSRRDAGERSRLIAHAHDEGCLLRGAVLGTA